MTSRARTRPAHRRGRGRARLLALVLSGGFLVAGCGTGGTTAAQTTSPSDATPRTTAAAPTPVSSAPTAADADGAALDPADGYVLSPTGPELSVLDRPGGSEVHRLASVRDTGAPLTLLLTDADAGVDADADAPGSAAPAGWYRVLVPVRPNGSTGWVAADDVTVARVTYRLQMSVQDNELRLFEEGRLLRTMTASSGTGDTPTPLGSFYLTELIQPTNAGYGPYAYGTSGFSDVLTSFGGGPGQIGLHGTDDPDSIGQAVSHGCIRLSDEDITYLAETLPLGTPIDVT